MQIIGILEAKLDFIKYLAEFQQFIKLKFFNVL